MAGRRKFAVPLADACMPFRCAVRFRCVALTCAIRLALGWVAFISADLAFGSTDFTCALDAALLSGALMSFSPCCGCIEPVSGLVIVDFGSLDTEDLGSLDIEDLGSFKLPGAVWAAAAAAMPAAKTRARGTVGENFIGVLRW